MSKNIRVSLVGNPNTGKTSLFNQLTGLNQKVGNYPGVTVNKKEGVCKLPNGKTATITDLPGTYSINPTSLDENIVLETLLKSSASNQKPDVILVVADVENLKRNLLLFNQIQNLNIPLILVINMADEIKRKGISINIDLLKKKLHTEIVLVSVRDKVGIDEIKQTIVKNSFIKKQTENSIFNKIDASFFSELEKISEKYSLYELWLMVTQNIYANKISEEEKQKISNLREDISKIKKYQHKETIYRYQFINSVLSETYVVDKSKATDTRSRLDRIFTHKYWGYIIFFFILALIFQSIFDWATVPMDFIDELFAKIAEFTTSKLPKGKLTDLVTEGIIPGIGGIVIFIPQIAILSLFIAILEETGYMSRVVFLMDKIMRRFGMNGKSIIPLISGTSCSIPAVMSTRTISNWKERLITILVTPFTTCSARLPVYAILIALIIPNKRFLGFGLQGITLLGLYILGFTSAIIAAYVLHKTLKIKSNSFFVVEMPDYKIPSIKNISIEVFEKTKAFVFGAGQIILAISIVLWFLASHSPADFNKDTESSVLGQKEVTQEKSNPTKLEKTYIGIAGKTIEPIVKPLGFDWKIGIGLISSFAAREVFVGTMATIYSVENEDDESTIKEKMRNEIDPETGKKRYSFATGMSLLIFYAFAMQCMATLAIVKRETNSWKWPIIQLVSMGLIAYVSSFIIYQFLK